MEHKTLNFKGFCLRVKKMKKIMSKIVVLNNKMF